VLYDGYYLNMMFATPHAWTQFAHAARDRKIIDGNLRHWDYRHQILAEAHMKPWEIFIAVKVLELYFHLRPRRLWRLLTAGRFSRHQLAWGLYHTGSVWLGETLEFLRTPRQPARTLAQFSREPLGECRHEERVALRVQRRIELLNH
jgi:anaerobic magnesium-protoporphyrin IX monomethyl ester cyclase